MHKTIVVAGAVHRKTFIRFFGQGVFSLFRDHAGGTGQPVAGAFLRFFFRQCLSFCSSCSPCCRPCRRHRVFRSPKQAPE
ncbi:MAG: hypothetical protein LBR26_05205 [Prevotella sp.]|nr:hypothetical protein [Prevotella sp.]